VSLRDIYIWHLGLDVAMELMDMEDKKRRIEVTDDDTLDEMVRVPVWTIPAKVMCDAYACPNRGEYARCYLTVGEGRYGLCVTHDKYSKKRGQQQNDKD